MENDDRQFKFKLMRGVFDSNPPMKEFHDKRGSTVCPAIKVIGLLIRYQLNVGLF